MQTLRSLGISLLLIGFFTFQGCSSFQSGVGKIKIGEASIENGDKPGIGYRLKECNGSVVSGEFFLFDPEKTGDFKSAGRKVSLQNLKQNGLKLSFTVDLNSKKFQETLLFSEPLKKDVVKTTILYPDSTTTNDLLFHRVK